MTANEISLIKGSTITRGEGEDPSSCHGGKGENKRSNIKIVRTRKSSHKLAIKRNR